MTDKTERLVGDYYQGTYGPTIILVAQSSAECQWLQEVFEDLAQSTGRRRVLTAEPGVRIADVETIEMISRPEGPHVSLRHPDNGTEKSFVWSAIPEGWQYLAELVQPLCDGGTGHHYLAEGKDDVALIELSVGEEEVLRSVREQQ